MAEQETQEQTGEQTDENLTQEEQNWKALRTKAEALETEKQQASTELEQAKRELAFAKAGVDTESKLGKMLLQTYDGELEPEAIKAEAQAVGMGEGQPSSEAGGQPVEQASEAERQMSEVAAEASTGAPPQHQVDDVYERASKEYQEDLAAGSRGEEAIARYISKVNYAAQSTDPAMSSQVDVRNHTERLHREAQAAKGQLLGPFN